MDQATQQEKSLTEVSTKTGRRELAQACSSRPLSNIFSRYYSTHGTITRIYSKTSKRARAQEKRRKEILNG